MSTQNLHLENIETDEGEALSFNGLYTKYSKLLFKTIKRRVIDHQLAEDLLQEAFIKIWISFKSFDANKGSVYWWMVSICNNVTTDKLRSKEQRLTRMTFPLDPLISTINVQRRVLLNTDAIDLIQNLLLLKKQHIDVLTLFYYSGYTHIEIANVLHIPLGTVKSRIRAALLHLKKKYIPDP